LTEQENDIMGFSYTKNVCEIMNLLSDF